MSVFGASSLLEVVFLLTMMSLYITMGTITAFSPSNVLTTRTSPFVSSFTGRSSTLMVVDRKYQDKQRRDRSSLSMMFDQLSNAISSVVKDFGPKQRITEESIKPALKSVRRALLDADVNINVADALIDGVKKRSLGEQVVEGVTADQQFIKAMYDELVDMMGGDSSSSSSPTPSAPPASTLAIGSPGNPAVVLLAGLQGAGKTTAAG
ncbi:MAG: signal recognition particle GTPase [Bacillariaceae sp.]|jgi:signal recognition particle subunit SRP54